FATDPTGTPYFGAVVVPLTVTGIAICPWELRSWESGPSLARSSCDLAADTTAWSLKSRDWSNPITPAPCIVNSPALSKRSLVFALPPPIAAVPVKLSNLVSLSFPAVRPSASLIVARRGKFLITPDASSILDNAITQYQNCG